MIIDRSQKIVTIPNMLSTFRILILPVFVYTYLTANTKEQYLFATFLFFLSSISDCLDGFIARKFNQVTELGKLLDPIGDKLTQVTLFFCLASRFRLMWIAAFVCAAKDAFMGIMGVIMIKYRRKKLDGAMWFGKVTTAVNYAAILVLLLFPGLNLKFASIMMFMCIFLMLLSVFMYIGIFINMWKGEETC